jgi:hypothetical protein
MHDSGIYWNVRSDSVVLKPDVAYTYMHARNFFVDFVDM